MRASGWSACFEECLTESFLARELEEEFEGLETSDDELCYLEEFDAMAAKTWYISPSSVTEVTLEEVREDGWFKASRVVPPLDGETTPNPPKGYAVVFRDFFLCGL
jgi:hypothetical protein